MAAVGKSIDPDLKARIERESEAVFSSARLWDDGVIAPAQTRAVVAQGLRAAAGGRGGGWGGDTRWGVFRM
jgi:3-methylcrotonyl-CoA carboxylase beta subunit